MTGKRRVRNYGFLSPGKRTESLARLSEIFERELQQAEADQERGSEELLTRPDVPPELLCPCCQLGMMVVVERTPRPAVWNHGRNRRQRRKPDSHCRSP